MLESVMSKWLLSLVCVHCESELMVLIRLKRKMS